MTATTMTATTMTVAAMTVAAMGCLSGCMTVAPQQDGHRPSRPSRPSASLVEPTRGPANDVLASVAPEGGGRKARPKKAEAREAESHPKPSHTGVSAPRLLPPLPAPPAPPGGKAQGRPSERPALRPTVRFPSGSGVCELGREFGHWPKDSPANRLCGAAYGN
jgi:hypothetical protein